MADENSNSLGTTLKISGVVLLLSLVYVFVRYNLVRDMSLEHFPLYLSNKAIALSATLLIGFSFVLGPLAGFFPGRFGHLTYLRKMLGIAGFGFAFMHGIMALLLFDKANYPRFYMEDGTLFWNIESSMLFAVISLLIFGIMTVIGIPSVSQSLTSKQWVSVLRFGYIAYFFVLLHVSFIGFRGWLLPSTREYGLITISLIAALFIVFVLLVRFLSAIFLKKK